MTLPPQAIAERLRLTRRVVLWRSLAALAAALAVVAWAGAAGIGDLFASGGERVAVLDVAGVIASDAQRDAAIKQAEEDDDVKALIVRIDSPGGTFVGSDRLHARISAFAAKKPVVAVIGDVAASGGYMAAVASERIYAGRGSITASVGVIFQSPRVNRLMESVGVDMDVWRSGELKALPSPFEAPSPAVRSQAQTMIERMFGLFLDMVSAGRDLTPAALAEVSDGRVVTGVRALELGLIDAIGDEAAARDWLAAEKNVSVDLPISNITPPPPYAREGLVGRAVGWALGEDAGVSTIGLSGILALWRPLSPTVESR